MESTDQRFEVKEGRPGTGLGLFAREAIKKGAFILEYVGRKIPTKLADTMTSRYLFEINENWTIEGPPEINLAGYINHSCDPNTEAEIDDGRIMIHAVKNIRAGEELTLDYGEEYFDEFLKSAGCKCGAMRHRR